MQLHILRLVNHTHPAAQFLDNAVMRNVWPMSWHEVLIVGNVRSNSWWGQMQLLLRVLRLGLLQDRDVGIGVFPEGQEVLIGFAAFCDLADKRAVGALCRI